MGACDKNPVRSRAGKIPLLATVIFLILVIASVGADSTISAISEQQDLGPVLLSCDINRDGVITSLDALIALQMSTGKIPPNTRADVNGDAKVTSYDAAWILRISTGSLPAPSPLRTDPAGGTGTEVYGADTVHALQKEPEIPASIPVRTLTVTTEQTLVIAVPATTMGGNAVTVAVSFSCPPGYSQCGDECRDFANDPSACGSCTVTCPPGFTCTGGICRLQCSTGLTACNGKCVNLLGDSGNCGSCDNTCMEGASCTNGQCVALAVTTQQTRLGGVGVRRL